MCILYIISIYINPYLDVCFLSFFGWSNLLGTGTFAAGLHLDDRPSRVELGEQLLNLR